MDLVIDSPVWYPHKVDGFRPGIACDFAGSSESVKVWTDNEKKQSETFQRSLVLKRERDADQEHCDDFGCLSVLNEASVLENIRVRFEQGLFYTNIGKTLVSVNPYEYLSENDARKASSSVGVYATAKHVYEQLMRQGTPQVCIVSGESGAGKTEFSRAFLAELVSLSANDHSQSKIKDTWIYRQQKRILNANPILECFGHARTTRNHHSSRFGKLIDVKFDLISGKPLSAKICFYLLEKSRIVSLAPGQRNFHIFYQILTDKELCQRFNLSNEASRYRLLQRNFSNDDRENYHSLCEDLVDFDEQNSAEYISMLNALDSVGFSNKEKDFILNTVCGLLLLGNTRIDNDESTQESKDDNSSIGSWECLDGFRKGCQLLHLDEAILQKNLTHRAIVSGRETFWSPIKSKEAENRLHSLIKFIYHALFSWLVQRINEELTRDFEDHSAPDLLNVNKYSTIGILDVFGYESLESNSLEQLCINYFNEKLQLYFNKLMFEEVRSEYESDGIITMEEAEHIPAEINGNIEKCIRLLDDSNASGLFYLIEDEIRLKQSSNYNLLRNFFQSHMHHPCFERGMGADKDKLDFGNSKLRRLSLLSTETFVVKHFAGDVVYSISGFLEKSCDPLPKEFQYLCNESGSELFRDMFRDEEYQDGGNILQPKKTVGAQFVEELDCLCEKIFRESSTHFVRCLKPNDEKQAKVWCGARVLQQVRNIGLLEAIKIRVYGFPSRMTLIKFARWCRDAGFLRLPYDLNESIDNNVLKKEDLAGAICEQLENRQILHPGRYRIGYTKIFFRDGQLEAIERKVAEKQKRAIICLQALIRGHLARVTIFRVLEKVDKILWLVQNECSQLQDGSLEYELRQIASTLTNSKWVFSSRLQETLEKTAQIVSLQANALRKINALESEISEAVQNRDWCTFSKVLTLSATFESSYLSECRALAEKLPKMKQVVLNIGRMQVPHYPCVDTVIKRRLIKTLVSKIRHNILVADELTDCPDERALLLNGVNFSLSEQAGPYSKKCIKEFEWTFDRIILDCSKLERHVSSGVIQAALLKSILRAKGKTFIRELSLAAKLIKKATKEKDEESINRGLEDLTRISSESGLKCPDFLKSMAQETLIEIRLARIRALNFLEKVVNALYRSIEECSEVSYGSSVNIGSKSLQGTAKMPNAKCATSEHDLEILQKVISEALNRGAIEEDNLIRKAKVTLNWLNDSNKRKQLNIGDSSLNMLLGMDLSEYKSKAEVNKLGSKKPLLNIHESQLNDRSVPSRKRSKKSNKKKSRCSIWSWFLRGLIFWKVSSPAQSKAKEFNRGPEQSRSAGSSIDFDETSDSWQDSCEQESQSTTFDKLINHYGRPPPPPPVLAN